MGTVQASQVDVRQDAIRGYHSVFGGYCGYFGGGLQGQVDWTSGGLHDFSVSGHGVVLSVVHSWRQECRTERMQRLLLRMFKKEAFFQTQERIRDGLEFGLLLHGLSNSQV